MKTRREPASWSPKPNASAMLTADLIAKIAKLPMAEQLWLADQFEIEAGAIRQRFGGNKALIFFTGGIFHGGIKAMKTRNLVSPSAIKSSGGLSKAEKLGLAIELEKEANKIRRIVFGRTYCVKKLHLN